MPLFSSKLGTELEKISGVLTPKELRNQAKEAIVSLTNCTFPILQINHPIINTILLIYENPKYSKIRINFTPILIDGILQYCFSGESLSIITKCLCMDIERIDWEQSRNLNYFTSSSINKNFPDYYQIQSCFSISISLMCHTDSSISGTSYVNFLQLLDTVVQEIDNTNSSTTFTEFCHNKFGPLSDCFGGSLHFILFLLFNDLSCIAINDPLKFLLISTAPIDLIFDILETILTTHSKVFEACPKLGNVFEGTVISSLNDPKSLPFIISFIQVCSLTHPSLCMSIFNEYISYFKYGATNLIYSLYLFHSFVFRTNENIKKFFIKTKEINFFILLIKCCNNLIQMNGKPLNSLTINLTSKKYQNILKDENNFILISPIEITFGILHSFFNDNNDKEEENVNVKELYVNCYSYFKDIINYSLKYSNFQSFQSVTNSFYELFYINYKNKIENETFETIINFDLFCNTKEMTEDERNLYEINQKNKDWNNFLIQLIQLSPEICNDQWDYLFASIFGNNYENNLSPSFASHFSNEIIINILKSLIITRPFPTQFITDFIISNITRFDILWPIIMDLFQNKNLENELFELFIDFINKAFIDITELGILKLGSEIIKNLSKQKKKKLLNQLKHVFAQSSQCLNKGFNEILIILNPIYYINDEENITIAFSLFNRICDECIYNIVNQNIIKMFIEITFKYISQKESINVSLSSFDVLWSLVKQMNYTKENWEFVLQTLINVWEDERQDIAQCSIKTFFTIISSVFNDIFKLLNSFKSFVYEIFPNEIKKFNDNNLNINVFQTVLYEISHFILNFLDVFDSNLNDLFDLLIKSQEKLIINCNAHETNVNALQFYYCYYSSNNLNEELENKLLNSFYILINEKFAKIDDQNAIIVSQFGRMLGYSIISLRENITEKQLKKWCDFIVFVGLNLKSVDVINVGTQRLLESIQKMFPLSEKYTILLYEAFVKLCCECNLEFVRDKVVFYLCKMCDAAHYEDELFIMCKKILQYKESSKIYDKLLQKDLTFRKENRNEAKEICMQIKDRFNGNEKLEKLIESLENE